MRIEGIPTQKQNHHRKGKTLFAQFDGEISNPENFLLK